MKTLIVILILLSFLQSTIIPLNLVLIILVLRSYLISGKQNLYLSFVFGLLISFLQNVPLGIHSLIFLCLIQLTQLIKKTPLSENILTVVPLILITSSINYLIVSIFLHSSVAFWPNVAIEGVLSLPLYLILRFWEERFVVKHEVKLKL